MKDIVPAIPGYRVGVVQDGFWLKILSACCGGGLCQTDEPESDDFDFYQCNTCGLEGGVVHDSGGISLGTRISVGAAKPRLEEWASAWLREKAVVRVF